MDAETHKLEILKNSNMDETTEFKIRKSAAEKLGMDLSDPTRKKLVRQVVETYLTEQQAKAEEQPPEEEEEEVEEDGSTRKRGGKEYDDEGGLIICRLSAKKHGTRTKYEYDTIWG